MREKPLLVKRVKKLKEIIGTKLLRVGISNKAEHRVYIWALEECKKYGSLNTYLELLYDVRNKILMQELFDNIFAIEELKNNNSCRLGILLSSGNFERLAKCFYYGM